MAQGEMMIKVSELSDSLLKKTSMAIQSFSTLLIRIPKKANSINDAKLIGSGTFITVNNVFGILTATHVVRELNKSDELGLILVEGLHKFSIDVEYLDIKEIGEYKVPGEGPDLAFVHLPNPKVSEIKPYKSFLNLSHDKEMLLNDPFDHHDGFWFICGAPDELTKIEDDKTIAYVSICGAGGVTKEYSKDGYDYIESFVEYGDHVELPMSFGGVSGGGLWQVRIRILEDGKYEPVSYILYGVPFYQYPYENNKRIIKCHGKLSLYEQLLNEISAPNPA